MSHKHDYARDYDGSVRCIGCRARHLVVHYWATPDQKALCGKHGKLSWKTIFVGEVTCKRCGQLLGQNFEAAVRGRKALPNDLPF